MQHHVCEELRDTGDFLELDSVELLPVVLSIATSGELQEQLEKLDILIFVLQIVNVDEGLFLAVSPGALLVAYPLELLDNDLQCDIGQQCLGGGSGLVADEERIQDRTARAGELTAHRLHALTGPLDR